MERCAKAVVDGSAVGETHQTPQPDTKDDGHYLIKKV